MAAAPCHGVVRQHGVIMILLPYIDAGERSRSAACAAADGYAGRARAASACAEMSVPGEAMRRAHEWRND